MKTGYKYILTPIYCTVGWYLSGKAVFNLNVYTNYGFLATSKPQNEFINKPKWYLILKIFIQSIQ